MGIITEAGCRKGWRKFRGLRGLSLLVPDVGGGGLESLEGLGCSYHIHKGEGEGV